MIFFRSKFRCMFDLADPNLFVEELAEDVNSEGEQKNENEEANS